MKLRIDAVIAVEKIAKYLLQWRPENDKSQFLLQAGYTGERPDQLVSDIRNQLLTLEANFEETTEYGDMFSIVGSLSGPNRQVLRVVSIWMIESTTGQTKFITLYPAKQD